MPFERMVAAAQEAKATSGEMRKRIQQFDWSATDIGRIENWCPQLRTTVSLCLDATFPAALYWGPDLRIIYNDAWAQLLGEKHPEAL
jgi:hypothetical protein